VSRPAWEPDDEDRRFIRVYGEWDPLTPAEVADLMTGFPEPWWIVGGHAIEAFTGVHRMHEDVDLVIFAKDIAALREQVGDRYHLWSNHGGTFRIIDDQHPEPLHALSQVWMRPDAQSPWVVDCILNPDVDGRWQSRHDDSFVAELDEVTWVAGDGVRYLNPEVALLFKAKQHRTKDEVDLENAWPLMSVDQLRWLRDRVAERYPEHPWTARLADA
jgi:hypothetical protein